MSDLLEVDDGHPSKRDELTGTAQGRIEGENEAGGAARLVSAPREEMIPSSGAATIAPPGDTTIPSSDEAIIPSSDADAFPSSPQAPSSDEGGRAAWAEPVSVESVVEAVLFSADRPMPARRLAQIVGIGGAADIKRHVDALNRRYVEMGAAFRIESIAKGYQMLTLPVYDKWIGQLVKARKDSRLSPAALETLAVIAYKQPAMRADVEAVRGVAVGDVLARLREMKLIKIVGRAEEIGRPLLYGTTDRFLEVFGLASLKDLPSVEALTPPEAQHRPKLVPAPVNPAE